MKYADLINELKQDFAELLETYELDRDLDFDRDFPQDEYPEGVWASFERDLN